MSDIDNIIKEINPKYKEPVEQHKLVYNSSSETLEPIYFWILDFMNNSFDGVTKIVDNFASSPGSGHFSELQGKASKMQQEASRVLGTVNNILKGIMQIIYDLREFRIRLSQYEEAKSKDPKKREAGLLALKQVWMDKVDMQRGQGSINALTSGQLNFVTLRDSFLHTKKLEDIDNLDLNERVKRVLKPRLQEFFEWRERSEQDLRKRFELERTYLKSQVNALKLNARWAKPYLKAAQQLEQNQGLEGNPELVSIFNTLLLELCLMGKNSVDVEQSVIDKDLPADFKKMKNLRKYHPIVFVDFYFRGIPSKAGQHYVFGGRAEVTFKAYALNEDEIELLKDKLTESDLEDSLKLVKGMTDESLSQIKADIEEFLPEEKQEEEEEKPEDINPFTALFSFFKPEKKKEEKPEDKVKELKEKGIKKENYAEKHLRDFTEQQAKENCFTVFDIYKKAHGMASFPY